MMRLLLLPVSALVALLPRAEAWERGAPPQPEDFVFVQKGTLPIIVSAPHGGRKVVPGIAERKNTDIAQFATVRDENTDVLAELFAAELEKKLGGKPWIVLARFDRKFIDANRPPELSFENAAAKPYYAAYHDPLIAACKAVKAKHGRGLLLDIHGQGQFQDTICRGTRNGKTVSLLVDRNGWTAVAGKNSVLGRLERDGARVLPTCDAPQETKEESKFSGGHIVGTYGSHTGYGIDAIQLEYGIHFRAKAALPTSAKSLADAVAAFHDAYLKD